MSVKDNTSSITSQKSIERNKDFQTLKEYQFLFRQMDEYLKDLSIQNKTLEILNPKSFFLRKVKFAMMDRILAQRRKNTREQNMKKIYSIIKQYLKDKRGINGFYKIFFKLQKIKFNQKNLRELLTSEPLKKEVVDFLMDEVAFKNYSLQYIEKQSNDFIQNYKINFQKYLFAGKRDQFLNYLRDAKKAKYPWTQQMIEEARKQFIDFFFKEMYQIIYYIISIVNYKFLLKCFC